MITIVNKTDFCYFKKLGNVYVVSWNPINITHNVVSCSQESIKLNKNMTYEQIVSKFIHVRYTSDEEVALINNALLNLENIANNDEYNEYQSWRAKCKEAAKQYLNKNEKVE